MKDQTTHQQTATRHQVRAKATGMWTGLKAISQTSLGHFVPLDAAMDYNSLRTIVERSFPDFAFLLPPEAKIQNSLNPPPARFTEVIFLELLSSVTQIVNLLEDEPEEDSN